MAFHSISQLQERMSAVVAQGLRFAGPDELDALAQEFFTLQLQQPAALLTQILQHVAAEEAEQKDAESFVKAQQILAHAEIQLSEAGTVDIQNLQEGYHGMYVLSDEMTQVASDDLNAILAISNPYLRGQRLIEYFQQASHYELVQSIEIVWFDYGLSNFVAEGLQARPEEAFKLAQLAVKHKNRVIWRTALKVLEKAGVHPSCRQAVLALLNELAERANKPSKWPDWHLLKEIIARIEGTYDEHLTQKQHTHRYLAANVQRLDSSKKSERYVGMYALLGTHDPYFTDVLVRALLAEDDQKNIRFLLRGLVDINGFEAIPYIAQMLGGPHTKQALAALTRFGDRCVLTYLFNNIPAKLAPSLYKNALPPYRRLAKHALIAAIKTLDTPETYKREFSTIFTALRSDSLAKELVAYAEHDAAFADKLFGLLRKLYPKQFKKVDSQTVKPSMRQMLGGRHIDKKGLSGLLITPDGKYLLTLSRGKGVDILSTTTWKQHASLKVEGYPMLFNLSPDGRYILTVKWIAAQRAYIVEIWEFGNWGTPVASFKRPTAINFAAMTCQNTHLLIGGEPTVTVLEFGTWREVIELKGHDGRVSYIQSIPGQNVTITGDWRGWLYVWDETTWNQIHRLKSDSWAPKFAELSSDGALLAYGGYPGIKIWETASWQEIVSMPKPKNINYLTLTPDAKRVIIGSGKKLKVLDSETWKETLKFDHNDLIQFIAALPAGNHVVTGGYNGIQVWDIGG